MSNTKAEEIAKDLISKGWNACWDMQSVQKGAFKIKLNASDIDIMYVDYDLPHGVISRLTLMYHTYSYDKVQLFTEMCRKVKY